MKISYLGEINENFSFCGELMKLSHFAKFNENFPFR